MLIIDTETTGLKGTPEDRVLEIGIAELDDSTHRIAPVYGALIRYPDQDEFLAGYERAHGPIWVFEHTDLRPEDLKRRGKDIYDVVDDVARIVAGRTATSYNVPFDCNRFLDRFPWGIRMHCSVGPDIMDLATERVRVLAEFDALEDKALQQRLLDDWRDRPDKWLRGIDAYCALCPDDPAGRRGVQAHRALDDAVQEAHILRAVWEAGRCPPTPQSASSTRWPSSGAWS